MQAQLPYHKTKEKNQPDKITQQKTELNVSSQQHTLNTTKSDNDHESQSNQLSRIDCLINKQKPNSRDQIKEDEDTPNNTDSSDGNGNTPMPLTGEQKFNQPDHQKLTRIKNGEGRSRKFSQARFRKPYGLKEIHNNGNDSKYIDADNLDMLLDDAETVLQIHKKHEGRNFNTKRNMH